ncbi:Exosc8, partial [Symbiodinium sp. CCMP2456]
AKGVTFLSRPLPATFAQMPGGQWVLDPCAVEEGLGASASLCNVNGSWLVFHQGGGADANRFLEELMPVARGCADKLSKLLEAPAE